MKLVDDAKDWPKWNSVHMAGVIIALPYAWAALPEEFKETVPPQYMPFIGVVMFFAFVLARVRAQK